MAERGEFDRKAPDAKVFLGAGDDMPIGWAVVLRGVRNLVALGKKQLILHFQAI